MGQPVEPSDEQLMKIYLSGDASAFDALYRRHSRRIYSYLIKRLSRIQDAEEIHQAVFFKFHRCRDQYDSKYPVLQWLFVISKTTLFDFFRKQGRQVPEWEGTKEEIKSFENLPTEENASAAGATVSLDGLSVTQKNAVQWRFLDDLTYEEIAGRLGKSETSARQTVSRAIRTLRKTFTGKGSEA